MSQSLPGPSLFLRSKIGVFEGLGWPGSSCCLLRPNKRKKSFDRSPNCRASDWSGILPVCRLPAKKIPAIFFCEPEQGVGGTYRRGKLEGGKQRQNQKESILSIWSLGLMTMMNMNATYDGNTSLRNRFNSRLLKTVFAKGIFRL